MKCSICKCWLIDDDPEIINIDGRTICSACFENEESECCSGCEFKGLCSSDPLSCAVFDLHIDNKFMEVGA